MEHAVILGTAGHVDHGKTALVKALTGVDTDRLEEERRRGITIDLGFAPLRLPGGETIGIVDVPGHEAFVRNMLAGATGVDLALLVVAADEGVMPQTREHVAILDLLGIRGGVIALTKCDLVDADWLELVRDDVRTATADSRLAGAELVATSVVSGAGLDELSAAVARAAQALPERNAADLFRMPIDRAFSVRGTGTVVTGTVWSGRLANDATVRILPGGRTVRVRGIESHGAAVTHALPGTRTAIALAGIEVSEVHRGAMLVDDAAWDESTVLLAEVALLDDAPRALGPRTAARFHLGTSEVGARVVALSGALAPGARASARVVLDAPVVARAGDRFVLRSTSPVATIGGGIVHDPAPPHRRPKAWSGAVATASDRLEHLLTDAGARGLEARTLAVRLGATPAGVSVLLAERGGRVRRLGDRVYAEGIVSALGRRLVLAVDEYLARAPLEPGAPLQSIRAQVGAEGALVDAVLADLGRGGVLEMRGAHVARTGWAPRPTAAQERARDDIATLLAASGREPPSVPELEARFGKDTASLLRLLEREGRVVQVESDRYYDRAALEALLGTLSGTLAVGREYNPAELRDVLGVSRKFLIPLLEYCDRIGITQRRAGGRVLSARARET